MINLSKRLSKIACMVKENSVIADIGCDHALLDIYLLKNNIIKRAIACDITKGAINQAYNNVIKYDVKNIDLRLGDGLNPLDKEDNIDTLVFSGLGNIKIINILKEKEELLSSVDTIIIQSNTMPDVIRKEVIKLGYKISDEVLVKERGIIYEIIKFIKGCEKYSKRQIYFGPVLLENKNDLFNEKINKLIVKENSILNKLPKGKIIDRIKIKLIIRKLSYEIKK